MTYIQLEQKILKRANELKQEHEYLMNVIEILDMEFTGKDAEEIIEMIIDRGGD